jgi:hypothetical protein
MKIIKNEKLIDRNSKIGQYTSLGALVILFGGMYISFSKPELFTLSIIALLVGFTMTQVGMYYGNRFGRHPRPDEQLDAALKGISDDFSLYHYTTPVSHLLVGPSGVWILMPYHQKGKVVFKNNKWKGSGGGFLQSYMRIFGQESLGRPDLETANEVFKLEKFFKKKFQEGEQLPTISAALVFLDPDVEIDSEGSPLPAMQVKKLKDFARKVAKEQPAGQLMLESARAALPRE